MQSKTKDLSEKNKAYCVYKYEYDNIDYDEKSYYAGREEDCTPKGFFRNGKTVCFGYSRLFKDIVTYLRLTIYVLMVILKN